MYRALLLVACLVLGSCGCSSAGCRSPRPEPEHA